jgi:hypothetical protein
MFLPEDLPIDAPRVLFVTVVVAAATLLSPPKAWAQG